MAELIPPDVLFFHILPKLPAKSLVRFMSVSKQWRSFIKTDTSFSDMHLLHVTSNDHQNNHKLLVLHKTPLEFRTVDCEDPDNVFTPKRRLPYKVNIDSYPTSILASCNGLVCVGTQETWSAKKYSDIVLWNSLTGEYKNLSKLANTCSTTSGRSFVLYYAPGDDDYRLLHVSDSNDVIIYSLKSNTWRKIESEKESCYMNLNRLRMVLYNGKIYILVDVERHIRVMTLDTTTEKFKLITTPYFGDQTAQYCSSFMAQRDCIWLCITREVGFDSDLWRMNEDGEWTKEVANNYLLNRPLYLMRNGKWLTHLTYYLVIVDLKNIKHIRSWSFDARYNYPENGIYVQSFVSPNRYTQVAAAPST